MLIASSRHSPADLESWSEYEEADLVYADIRRTRMARLVDESMSIILDYPVDHVDTSWGKDSVVLCDLYRRAGIAVPRVYFTVRGCGNPDCPIVRDAFGPVGGEYWALDLDYEQCANEAHWRMIDQRFGERRATGLRADESSVRRMSIAYLGVDTGRSVRPLAKWALSDVFAYLAERKLPVHPAYGCLGGGRWPRHRIRVHGLGGRRGDSRGRREWEQEYYGDVLRRMNAQKEQGASCV